MRLSRPVAVMAAARNSADCDQRQRSIGKAAEGKRQAALVPSRAVGIGRIGRHPSRNAISAAMTTAETA